MKKRIGTKLYDTDTAELLTVNEWGKLYRKRTRDRECFLVNDGNVIPLTDKEAAGWLDEDVKPVTGLHGYHVRVDGDTHSKLSRMAKAQGIPISEVVRRITEKAG